MPEDNHSVDNIKKILILGHKGFIGKYLLKFFEKEYPELEIAGIDLPETDLTKKSDVFKLKEFFDKNTSVIMCSCLKREHGDNIDNFLKNLMMVFNLCRLLEKNPINTFIYLSSAAVYGEDIHNTNITEETSINPTSYYGLAKFSCERLLSKSISLTPESKLIILRPAVIYGPGDKPCYGPSGFSYSAIKNEKITLWGDGTEKREFVIIDDLANLINRLLSVPTGAILNIVSGKSSTFKDVLDIISSITSIDLNITSKKRTKDKVDNIFNNQKIYDLFPDFKFIPLEEGIKKTVDYAKSQN
ncbi:NAD-dependent dehydratase [Candidatus Woesearchaeota archaeon]|nr:NAD-dependent dehydratase [Candidatus Woesearchaeota archaeon]|tara:strand:- start:2874 stop:3776 length:903 start_codon:yes stop_codon:yes gene_type:complete